MSTIPFLNSVLPPNPRQMPYSMFGLVGDGNYFYSADSYLTVEDILWCGFLELHVPNQGHSIWFMRSVFIVVVGSHHQLGVLNERGYKDSLRSDDAVGVFSCCSCISVVYMRYQSTSPQLPREKFLIPYLCCGTHLKRSYLL